ncbi:hypothetical protein CCO03_02680 [Comamonas serinivorans]|uniref:Uncharacterized protein n=1 Tax=Comamonas serinivorans TaxID=1082851 RepID=A0A1Y0EJC6_9BURK|nr:hypothetical protein [Comamonas serinivorans]ARU03735.1 hypothetical protein CCO03_02680 [Comamonas serinivorans]
MPSAVQTLPNGMQVMRSAQLMMADAALSDVGPVQQRRFYGVMAAVAVVLLIAAQPGAAYNNGGTSTWTPTFWGIWFSVLVVATLVMTRWQKALHDAYVEGGMAVRDAEARVRAWGARHPEWSLQLYDTKWSLRVVATQAPMPTHDPRVAQLARGIRAAPFWADQCRRNGVYVAVVRLADVDAPHAPPVKRLAPVGNAPTHPALLAELQQHDAALGLAPVAHPTESTT